MLDASVRHVGAAVFQHQFLGNTVLIKFRVAPQPLSRSKLA